MQSATTAATLAAAQPRTEVVRPLRCQQKWPRTSTEPRRYCYPLSLLRLGFTMHGRASFPVPTIPLLAPGYWPGGEREGTASRCSCLVLLHRKRPHVAMCVWADNVHHASLSLSLWLVIRELERERGPARRTGWATVKELRKGKGIGGEKVNARVVGTWPARPGQSQRPGARGARGQGVPMGADTPRCLDVNLHALYLR